MPHCTHLASVEVPTVGVETVEAQRRIDGLLDGDPCPRLAGEQLELPVYLRCLQVLCKLIYDTAPPSSPPRRRLSDDPATLAAVLPGGLELADLPDRQALVDATRERADRRYHQDGSTLRVGQLGHVPDTMRDALRHAPNGYVLTHVAARTGIDIPTLTSTTFGGMQTPPDAQPAYCRATVARYRHDDPEFDQRYRQLLDGAEQARRAAGFAHANLTRALTPKLPEIQLLQLEHDPGGTLAARVPSGAAATMPG